MESAIAIVPDDSPTETQSDRAQIWIIGNRDQVVHLMNECYVSCQKTSHEEQPIV